MKKFLKFCLAIFIIGFISVTGFIICNLVYVINNPISIEQLQPSKESTVIYDDNGKVYSKLGLGVEKSTYSDEFPNTVKEIVISIEDKRFYDHCGVDFIRTGKVIFDTLKNQSFGSGGSTITQQLVKNSTGATEISIIRKVREWIYAIILETQYSKEQIITQYLNIVYMGKGIYGFSDAAVYYFGKNVDNLTINEVAFLAGAIKSPETYINNVEIGNERKNIVLDCLYNQGKIRQETYSKLIDEDIIPKNNYKTNIQSWFEDALIIELANFISQKNNIDTSEAMKLIYEGEFKIYSTVNVKIQSYLEKLYATMDNELDTVESASVILTTDGKIAGMVGGTGYKSGDLLFNRATSAKRQTGSAMKPLAVYAPCFELGVIDNTRLMEDKALSYGSWNPTNFYSGYKGYMTIRHAIEISNNTIPIQLLEMLNTKNSYTFLKSMGFKNISEEDENLALAIGALFTGVTPLEMASGYQTLANEGVWCEPIYYTKVVYKGKEIYNTSLQRKRKVFSEETAYLITDLLVSVVEGDQGTAKPLKMNQVLAAKTGTTDNYNDKWICTYTPYYVTSTWYGYDIPQKVIYTSSTLQSYVKSILTEIHSGLNKKEFDRPSTIKQVKICDDSHQIASLLCTNTRYDLVDLTKKYTTCTACKTEIVDKIEEKLDDTIIGDILNQVENFINNSTSTVSEKETTIYETEVQTDIEEIESQTDIEMIVEETAYLE